MLTAWCICRNKRVMRTVSWTMEAHIELLHVVVDQSDFIIAHQATTENARLVRKRSGWSRYVLQRDGVLQSSADTCRSGSLKCLSTPTAS